LTLPKGKSTLTLTSSGPIEVSLAGEPAKVEGNRATIRTESTGDVAELIVTLRTDLGGKPPALDATYQAGSNPAVNRIAGDRLTLPWAPAPPSAAPPMAEPTFDLAGGDRARGEEVFRGDQAKCASCHKVRGQGGEVGPDLTGLVGKPRLEVFRDIFDPSATIRPDYLAYTVATKDGRVMVGTVRAEGADSIRVTDTDAKSVLIRRDEIEQLEPSPASIMPVGLVGVIGEEKTRDLLAYLTSAPPPEPARRP
jgi:putative heme-binding domain-containing protein